MKVTAPRCTTTEAVVPCRKIKKLVAPKTGVVPGLLATDSGAVDSRSQI
jgi:hypothetical protein